jgi:nucleoside-diphosphate-sugar epimerase
MQDLCALTGARRIAVLGGAGFVGSALVRRLVRQRHSVCVVDNFFHGSRQHLADIPGLGPLTELDALDYPALRECLIGTSPDVVVNCIGDTFIPSAYDVPERFLDLNVRTTLNVLRACSEAKVKRILHLSSTEVYGDHGAHACTEAAPLAPVNTYAVSKMAADRLCYTFALEHELPTVIARLFNAYGPRETHPYIVPELIAQLAVSNRLKLGNLDAERDLTYVDDTAAALDALLWIPVQRAEVFNIGSGDVVSVRTLARVLGTLMGHETVEFSVERGRLRRRDLDRLCCDGTKLRTRTGWTPSVALERGLGMTVGWFRQNGSRWLWQERLEDRSGREALRESAKPSFVRSP